METIAQLTTRMQRYVGDSTLTTSETTPYLKDTYQEMPMILKDTWLDRYFKSLESKVISADTYGNYIEIPDTVTSYETPGNMTIKEFKSGSNRKIYLKRAASPQILITYAIPTAISWDDVTVFKDVNIDDLLALYASYNYLIDIKRYEDADRLQLKINDKETKLFSIQRQTFIDYQWDDDGSIPINLS